MKAILVLASIVLGWTNLAEARGRGGGGRGGHGHSGGSSSGGSRGSSHSHGARRCVETTAVLGYRKCSKFGAWSWNVPELSIDLGVVANRFASDRLGDAGTFTEDMTQFDYRFAGAGNRITTAVAPQLRVALHGPRIYVATELEVGGVTSGPAVSAELDGWRTSSVSTTYAAMRGVVGTSLRLEPVTVSAELAGGMRLLAYKIDDEPASSFQGKFELQARVRLDVWITPRMTLGATLGASLVDRGDTIVGISLGGHLRAFGGQ